MKKFLIIFILLIGIVLLDGFFINSKGFKVVEESIEVASLENSFDGFKIMQISDFLIKDKNDLDNIKNIVALKIDGVNDAIKENERKLIFNNLKKK